MVLDSFQMPKLYNPISFYLKEIKIQDPNFKETSPAVIMSKHVAP